VNLYIGLDASSKVVGAVVIHKDGWTAYSFPLHPNHVQGAFDAFHAMHTIIDNHPGHDAIYVYMEEPFVFKGRPGATIPQAHCQGGIMAAAWQQEVHFEQINNKTVKARIVDNGNADKDAVTAKMEEIWPELVAEAEKHGKWKQDVVDAGMIVLYAQRAVELRSKVARHLSRKG
jgi:Holliday junction resolvasome RuvABC endonuclease subunit